MIPYSMTVKIINCKRNCPDKAALTCKYGRETAMCGNIKERLNIQMTSHIFFKIGHDENVSLNQSTGTLC